MFGGTTAGFGAGSAPAFGAGASTQSAFNFGALSSAAGTATTASPLFGAGAGSKPAFAAATPGFGTATGGLFGGSSTPGLAASSAPAFGATGAFGAATTSTGLFGVSQPLASPLFGQTQAAAATAATPLFGAAPAATSSPGFPFAAQSSPFGTAASTPAFSLTLAPTSGGMFRPPATTAMPQQPFAAPGQQQPSMLTYNTKWDDIPPAVQNELLELEKVVESYRKDCETLDREPRLKDSASLKKNIESDLGAVRQAAQSMLAALRGDEDTVADIHEKVNKLLRSTETAVRTYNRARLWREGIKGASIPPAAVQELISMPVVLPAAYLEQCTAGFQEVVMDLRRALAATEAVLPLPAQLLDSMAQAEEQADVSGSLQTILRNVHDFIMHLAARTATVHDQVQQARDRHLAELRQQGDQRDPFQEERRRRTPPAAAKLVIPPAQPRPAQAAGPQSTPGQATAAPQLGFGTPAMPGGFSLAQPQAAGVSAFPTASSPFGAPAANPAANAQRQKSASQRRRS